MMKPLSATTSPKRHSNSSGSRKSAVKRLLGRLVDVLYTQIVVAIFAMAFFSIYRSSRILFPSATTTNVDHLNPSSRNFSRSMEAQLRQEALEKLAKEAALFEDDDIQINNAAVQGGSGQAGESAKGKQESAAVQVQEDRIVSKNNNNNNGDVDTSGFLVQHNEFIYRKLPGESAPIVLEEFKLIFFAQAKVGCTVWKMLFRRMMGIKDWRAVGEGMPHVPEANGLKYLYHYNLSYASHIMTAPDWTRAIFIRDPKERFFSAYLDKAVEESLFVDTCCNRIRHIYCNPAPPPVYEFLAAIQTCKDSHWDPQVERMEGKYWPYINFVGKLETVQADAKKLLQRVHAWQSFGSTGWGPEKNAPIFASSDGLYHANNAKDKIEQFIYPELEQELEDFYDADYKSQWFNVSQPKKFPDMQVRPAVDHATLDLPFVQPQDWIYRKSRRQGEAAPIVLEKFKLVFFAVPHVAENEFKRLFRRMIGERDWKTRTYNRKNPVAINEGLVYLRDYNLTRASEIMTSPEWTRAIFVRDPKERFALAYTQTAVRNRLLLHHICCTRIPRLFCLKGFTTRDLVNIPNATEFLQGIKTCKSTHWDPLTQRLGAIQRLGIHRAQKQAFDPKYFVNNKFWKYINFVGNMDKASQDAKVLLERVGAWAEFGETGWADDAGERTTGHDSFFTTASFLKQELKAKKFVQQIIKDPMMERDIEKFYESDYMSPWFELQKKVLFSSSGNNYGKVKNLMLSDFKKVQQENAQVVQRQW